MDVSDTCVGSESRNGKGLDIWIPRSVVPVFKVVNEWY